MQPPLATHLDKYSDGVPEVHILQHRRRRQSSSIENGGSGPFFLFFGPDKILAGALRVGATHPPFREIYIMAIPELR